MTLDEALAKLGLSRHTSPEEARRAYLRLLKHTRPEVNRDEFIALRDAYEAVRTMLEFMARYPSSGGAAEIQPLGGDHDDDTAQQQVIPPSIPGTKVTAPDVEPQPRMASRPALTLAEQAMHMCGLFDEHGHEPDAIPPVVLTLRLVFSCLANGDVEPARTLSNKLSAWLRQSGRETFLGSELVPVWVTARELAHVARVLPPRVLVPIAEAALAGDLGKASQRLSSLRVQEPEMARAALTELKLKAPWLATSVGWCLAPPPRKRWRLTFGWPGSAVPVVIFLVLRLISAGMRSSSDRPVDPPRTVLQTSPAPLDQSSKLDAGAVARLKRVLGIFFELTTSVEESMQKCNMPPAAALVKQLREDVRNGNCSWAENPMGQLRDLKTVYPPDQWQCASEHVDALQTGYTLVCAEAKKVLDERGSP